MTESSKMVLTQLKGCAICNEPFAEEGLGFGTKDGTPLIEDAGSASEPPPTIMAPPPAVPQPQLPNLNLPAAENGTPVPQIGERLLQPEMEPPPPPSYSQPPANGFAPASMDAGISRWLCLCPDDGSVVTGEREVPTTQRDGKLGGKATWNP